jgi:hypothetical protein
MATVVGNVVSDSAEAAPYNRTDLNRADLGRVDRFCALRNRFEDGGHEVTVSADYGEPVESTLPDGGTETEWRFHNAHVTVEAGQSRDRLEQFMDGPLLVGVRRALKRER